MKASPFFLLAIGLLFFQCAQKEAQRSDTNTKDEARTETHMLQVVLWQQNAAEYRALSYQAYNMARLQLDKIIADNPNPDKPLAIVTDLDETVLDNSPYNAKQLELDEGYSRESWIEWGEMKVAEPVPGSLSFFQYAASQGVEVYYISNRLAEQQLATMENMERYNFPYLDSAHFFLKEKSSGKQPRRDKVTETHEIVMLLGDNLSDFNDLFDNQRTDRRNFLADSLQALFGSRYIVLPNPMYGDWETKGIFEGNHDWTTSQKDSIRYAKLKAY